MFIIFLLYHTMPEEINHLNSYSLFFIFFVLLFLLNLLNLYPEFFTQIRTPLPESTKGSCLAEAVFS